MPIDKAKIEKAVRMILEAIGEDPEREGLRETPRRVADMFEELLEGYDFTEEYTWFTEATDLVVVSGIRFYSLCEHHLLPFFGVAHVAYLPRGKVIGLSKIVRIVNKYSRRLQIQERMTKQIADEISKATGSPDVMVITEAVHLCMAMRGVRNGAPTVVAAVRGEFERDQSLKEEVYRIIEPHRLSRVIALSFF
ncbi:GTP cyclohydrolase I FolE [Hyperthermus butylicus]|uniref:GTP cyclohydrolase 1 n=1 Tax=Hyperthermus butylicus (strain DSM 5456 / JCM 9403 / PLM1-5) TaxID=415426 RepID=GCH1_HYPBU|nr:RecName: Full=GTP cyclohydrolase 1; AltName: Full=GTP cyclohydrolase I; Short=GTP-CH-I [Hyperthermus butylicus DSM 5456]ABM80719.1 GTP cyclohydrolase I [Hyperthermus butylicus DSM 5456]